MRSREGWGLVGRHLFSLNRVRLPRHVRPQRAERGKLPTRTIRARCLNFDVLERNAASITDLKCVV